MKTTLVDDYSPDRILTIYKNNVKINVKSIKYMDGTILCKGTNLTVNINDLTNEKKFIVELNDNSQVVVDLAPANGNITLTAIKWDNEGPLSQ